MELQSEESARILVVDDEKVIREILSDFLTLEGFIVRTAENGEAAVAELERRSYNVVISDLKMPRLGGLELLEIVNGLNPNILTVIMTGFGTVETAIEAMKKGAYDYVLKPFKVEEVVRIIRRGLDRQRLQMENIRLKEALGLYRVSEAISQSLSLDHILELVTETTLEETRADLVTLLLEEQDSSGDFRERIRRVRRPEDGGARPVDEDGVVQDLAGELDISAILARFQEDLQVLAQGQKAHVYFRQPPRLARLVSFCAVPLKVQHEVVGLLNVFSFTRGYTFTEGQRKMLSIISSRAAVSIENARLYSNLLLSNRELEQAKLSLEENFRQTIVAFAQALEETDRYTRGHSERVSVYARLTAEALELPEAEVETVVQAALMHDIGKIGIRYEQLNKGGQLTRAEIAMFRNHPEKGKRILEPIPFLRQLIPGCYCHHEHWDGGGYPQGLKGEEIPLLGRVIAVADTYDAMTTDRAYREAPGHDAAVAELQRCCGTQFDPKIVPIFIREIERFRRQPLGLPADEPLFVSVGGFLAGAAAGAGFAVSQRLPQEAVEVQAVAGGGAGENDDVAEAEEGTGNAPPSTTVMGAS